MKFDVTPIKKFKHYNCEWIDRDQVVLSKFGKLYFFNQDLTVCQETVRVGSALLGFAALLFPPLARLLRYQFYNVIKLDSKWYLFFGKKIFLYADKKLIEIETERKFRVFRGGVATVGKALYFGEYFNNPDRGDVQLYRLEDTALEVFHVFPPQFTRHIHSVSYNAREHSLYVLTGDFGDESRILSYSLDTEAFTQVAGGSEDFRAIVIHFKDDGFVYATDAQFQENKLITYTESDGVYSTHRYFDGPVFYSVASGTGAYMSTAYEGAPCQKGNAVDLFYVNIEDGSDVHICSYEKDRFNTRYFQFGYLSFPNSFDHNENTYFTPIGLKGFPGLHQLTRHEG